MFVGSILCTAFICFKLGEYYGGIVVARGLTDYLSKDGFNVVIVKDKINIVPRYAPYWYQQRLQNKIKEDL